MTDPNVSFIVHDSHYFFFPLSETGWRLLGQRFDLSSRAKFMLLIDTTGPGQEVLDHLAYFGDQVSYFQHGVLFGCTVNDRTHPRVFDLLTDLRAPLVRQCYRTTLEEGLITLASLEGRTPRQGRTECA